MGQRGITEEDVSAALDTIHTTFSTPEDSTCIVGGTSSGRELKVWVVGGLPFDRRLIVKSVAWKDVSS